MTARIQIVPGGGLGRLIAAVIAIALLILLFFFFTLALFAFGALLVIILVRIFWPARKPLDKTSPGIIEGEYSERPQLDAAMPATRKSPKDVAPR